VNEIHNLVSVLIDDHELISAMFQTIPDINTLHVNILPQKKYYYLRNTISMYTQQHTSSAGSKTRPKSTKDAVNVLKIDAFLKSNSYWLN
jgi:hypothetical protein